MENHEKTHKQKIQDCLDIQCANGNWDYAPYMHGMANGLILAMAILEDKEPEYLDAPAEWLCDKKDPQNAISEIS